MGGRLPVTLIDRVGKAFQFTPLRGGRPELRNFARPCIGYFNSRPRVGGDYAGSTQAAAPHISIHAPAWGATASLASLRGTLRFQFTPPRGGRQGSPAHPAPSHNFNSRPRVGGDCAFLHNVHFLLISIHAPAWGATGGWLACNNAEPISIHAPAWGATGHKHISAQDCRISIHAPAWGATYRIAAQCALFAYFNSRPRVGGDVTLKERRINFVYFNSRPRVGGDPKLQTYCIWLSNFNSRPRVGGDSHKRR